MTNVLVANNTYNLVGIGPCQIDCAKERLIERSKYYESDKNSQLYDALRRFNTLCE